MRCSIGCSVLTVALSVTGTTLGAQAVPEQGAQTAGGKVEQQASKPWEKIPIPSLPAFHPREPKRIELPNGVVLFLQEDHELPFINGSVLIRGGRRDEPAPKAGLVSLYGQTWRTSGSEKTGGDALDDELENKAAQIETRGGLASTSLSWSSLKADFDPVFASACDLLQHPAFKADKLALAKQQMFAGIARRNDSPDDIEGREVAELAYGKGSPYAREPEYASVDAVTVSDLEAWHSHTLVANAVIVSVSGDFESSAMEAKLRAVFSSLKRGEAIAAPKSAFQGPQPGVYFVEKSDVNQSTVSVFGLGTERNNPDLYALAVMNEIFSGGFGSRVVQDIRTKLGLAYSVGGSYGAAYDHPGLFRVGLETKSVSTAPATKAVLDEISRLKTVPPSEGELRSAKDQVLNSFIFNYDSPDKTLTEQVTLAFYGYPVDFLEKYRAGVEKVTSADVARVAQKYIDPTRLAILVIGNGQQINPPLKELGAVKTLDISIPPPPPFAKGAAQ